MSGLLKGFAGLGGFFTLAIGLGMLGVTIYAFIYSSLVFGQYTLLGILLAADLLIIFGSVIGIIGIKRGNGFMICIFQLLVLIFCVTFLGLGIAAETGPKTIFAGNCTHPTNDLVKFAAQAYKDSTNLLTGFCSPACPCGLTSETIDKANYTITERARVGALTRTNPKVLRFQQCPQVEEKYNQTLKAIFNSMGSIEEMLDCSGWCYDNGLTTSPIIYQFSDVNDGKPKTNGCYSTMKLNLEKYGHVIAIAAFSVFAFLFLLMIVNVCICCSPDRRSLPLRERFVYNDRGYYRQM